MRARMSAVCVALILLIAAQGFTQLSVRESFDYAEGVSMDTLLGTAGNGWGSGWDLFDGNEGVMTVADSGVVYEDLYDPVPMEGLQITGTNLVAWQWQRYRRDLDQLWPDEGGAEYWISCLYQLDEFINDGWALVSLYQDTTELAGIGHEWGSEWLGIATYNDEGRSDVSCNDGPQWLVARIIMSGDTSQERVFMWVSPDPMGSEPDTLNADARGNWQLSNGFDRVVIHFGGGSETMSMSVDELRLGASWEDVSSELSSIPGRTKGRPDQFILAHNYPNPFNPATQITYTLPQNIQTDLIVYDLTGREIAVLYQGMQVAGVHTALFDGRKLSSGVYVYTLRTNAFTVSRKMILIK